MTYVDRADNLVNGLGGYENCISIRCDEGAGIHITVKDPEKVSRTRIKQDDYVTGIYEDGGEITITMRPDVVNGIYAILCIPPLGNAPQEDSDFPKAPGKKYTADYFIDIAEKAVNKMPILQIEKNTVMGFVLMISEEAARFVNEKELDNDFEFVPGFVDAVTRPKEKDGETTISGNVFACADKKIYISVQYQRKGINEAYNLLMTDMGMDDGIRYIGKIRGFTNGSGQDTEDTAPVIQKDGDTHDKVSIRSAKKTDSVVSLASDKEPADEAHKTFDEVVSALIPLVTLVLIGILVIFAMSVFASPPGQLGEKLIIAVWCLSLTGIGYVVFGLFGYHMVYYRGNSGRGLVYASSFIAWGIVLVTIALFIPVVDMMGIH